MTALGIVIYRIDVEAIEQFVNEHLKDKLRQLKLSDIRLKQNSIEEEVKAEKFSVCVCREALRETKHAH
ncbi:MAG: hypothetical protein QW056_07085 [Candidatus Bathyarchaeia archaeon]